MLKILKKQLGTVHIGSQEELFTYTIQCMNNIISESKHPQAIWGLGGGSTPQAFFKWAIANQQINQSLLHNSVWTCSDERHVSLSNDQSNFGNALRLLLDPLHVTSSHKMPWPTHFSPEACAEEFNHEWNNRFGIHRAFDICFLGMGDDCHTASLFPGCDLNVQTIHETTNNFAATEWPGKGWRLTITPAGLSRCDMILLSVTGKNKAEALKRAFSESYDPLNIPVHILQNFAEKTHWLVDDEAASAI